jgi:hypothetical protein
MSLGLNTEAGGGDYKPIVKFDARAGRFFRVDRIQDSAGNWQTSNVEITNGFQAVMDLDAIEVGWALLAAGVAPSWSMVPLGQPLPPKPSDQHKQCFRLMLKLGKTIGGDAREFASQAKVVIGAMDELHTQFVAGKAANPGKLPVVALTGTVPVVSTGKGQSSTNYKPVFAITSWIDRPPELNGAAPAAAAASPAPAAAPQPAAAPVQQAPVPAGAEF